MGRKSIVAIADCREAASDLFPVTSRPCQHAVIMSIVAVVDPILTPLALLHVHSHGSARSCLAFVSGEELCSTLARSSYSSHSSHLTLVGGIFGEWFVTQKRMIPFLIDRRGAGPVESHQLLCCGRRYEDFEVMVKSPLAAMIPSSISTEQSHLHHDNHSRGWFQKPFLG